MTWTEVANEAVMVIGTLGVLAFLVVLVNGWPKRGRRCKCKDHDQ